MIYRISKGFAQRRKGAKAHDPNPGIPFVTKVTNGMPGLNAFLEICVHLRNLRKTREQGPATAGKLCVFASLRETSDPNRIGLA